MSSLCCLFVVLPSLPESDLGVLVVAATVQAIWRAYWAFIFDSVPFLPGVVARHSLDVNHIPNPRNICLCNKLVVSSHLQEQLLHARRSNIKCR
ncbi:hypothetical protein BDF14DRAFT_1998942 [Spinellus fusiger]|nr:hypothetical protein BDF14DRAFT_1998942 [Spinellus fusiger]